MKGLAGASCSGIQCVLKLEDTIRFLYRLPSESLLAPPLFLSRSRLARARSLQ